MFAFFVLHLFSAGGRHLSSVSKLIHLIERLEKLHTEAQGFISSPNHDMTILFDVSRRWIQYLNRCVALSDSKVEEVPGASVPFSLK